MDEQRSNELAESRALSADLSKFWGLQRQLEQLAYRIAGMTPVGTERIRAFERYEDIRQLARR